MLTTFTALQIWLVLRYFRSVVLNLWRVTPRLKWRLALEKTQLGEHPEAYNPAEKGMWNHDHSWGYGHMGHEQTQATITRIAFMGKQTLILGASGWHIVKISYVVYSKLWLTRLTLQILISGSLQILGDWGWYPSEIRFFISQTLKNLGFWQD